MSASSTRLLRKKKNRETALSHTGAIWPLVW
jgi:hypothetical protein